MTKYLKYSYLLKDICGIIDNYLLPNLNNTKKIYNRIIRNNIERWPMFFSYSIRKKHCKCYRFSSTKNKYYINKRICKCSLKLYYDWYDIQLTALSLQCKRIMNKHDIK